LTQETSLKKNMAMHFYWHCFVSVVLDKINVREYRRVDKKWTIQRNWQHRIHKTSKSKTKTQHNMCWTPVCAKKHKQRK